MEWFSKLARDDISVGVRGAIIGIGKELRSREQDREGVEFEGTG